MSDNLASQDLTSASQLSDGASAPTYRNSEIASGINRASSVHNSNGIVDAELMRATESGGRASTTSSSGRMTEMRLMAVDPSDSAPPEQMKDYKGRIRTWPGILLMLAILGGACALITWQSIETSDSAKIRRARYEYAQEQDRAIKDNKTNDDGDIVSDDGQVGNPKSYPDMGCELPNYLSKDGQIYAVAKNGTEVVVGIKGVNWFGMETGLKIPFGMWENEENGTTAYEIAAFLARNNFNSIRLPVCIESILSDEGPDKSLINVYSNRAIDITSYISTIQSIVEVMAYRHITVMISLHTLTTETSGGAWYDADLGVTEEEFLTAVDTLTKNLCSSKYWNILGLDLKNEPHTSSWGGADPDWVKGAALIGNRMLEGCPSWLAFVEGTNSAYEITLMGTTATYYDWWGGGLEKAGDTPITFDVENKLVWAPHYYTTAVSPAWYFYEPGSYTELDDTTLKSNIEATMDAMFAYLTEENKYAMVLGEFAGLYSKDAHPKKTTKRTTDFTIEVLLERGIAGGYMWSLNPESAYQYNPADTQGTFTEGLLEDDWLSPNTEFLNGIAALDVLPNLKKFPCFPEVIESSSSSSS